MHEHPSGEIHGTAEPADAFAIRIRPDAAAELTSPDLQRRLRADGAEGLDHIDVTLRVRATARALDDGTIHLDGTASVVALADAAEQALRLSERMVIETDDQASDFVVRADADGTIRWVSSSVVGLLGWQPEQLLGRRLSDLSAPDAEPPDVAAPPGRRRLHRPDGTFLWMDVVVRTLLDDDGAVFASVTWCRDVSTHVEAEERLAASEAHFRLLAENVSDVVVLIGSDGSTVEWVSPSLTEMTGWSPEEWIGHSITEFGHPDELGDFAADRNRFRAGQLSLDHGAWVSRSRQLAKDGTFHWIETHTRGLVDPDGSRQGAVLSFRVVDTEVDFERELERRARLDDLTGVLKRDAAMRRLEGAQADQRQTGGSRAVLFVDVDAFKSVNDEHGHAAGDALLRALADRIVDAVRSEDTVARMGGDEFLVLLEGVHSQDQALALAEKIRAVAAEPVDVADGAVSASVSIGVTLGRDGESADALVARADAAMYEAKRAGRNRVVAIAAD
jgi:diguanylate cyclase (GGDEF)-like protein/PAS domain S-box-containing protein